MLVVYWGETSALFWQLVFSLRSSMQAGARGLSKLIAVLARSALLVTLVLSTLVLGVAQRARAQDDEPPEQAFASDMPVSIDAGKLRAQLLASLKGENSSQAGVFVQNMSTGAVVFAQQGALPAKPASVLKVVTSGAAVKVLGARV